MSDISDDLYELGQLLIAKLDLDSKSYAQIKFAHKNSDEYYLLELTRVQPELTQIDVRTLLELEGARLSEQLILEEKELQIAKISWPIDEDIAISDPKTIDLRKPRKIRKVREASPQSLIGEEPCPTCGRTGSKF